MILTASCVWCVAGLANMTNLKLLNLKDNSFSFLSGQGIYILTKPNLVLSFQNKTRTKRYNEMQV